MYQFVKRILGNVSKFSIKINLTNFFVIFGFILVKIDFELIQIYIFSDHFFLLGNQHQFVLPVRSFKNKKAKNTQ